MWRSQSQLIASGDEDRTVRIWTAATQKQVALLGGHPYPVHSVAFSPDASMLAVYSGEPRLWNLSDGTAPGNLLPNVDTSSLEGIAVLTSILASARNIQLGGGPVGAPPIGAATMPTGMINPIARAFYGRLPVSFSPDGKHLAVVRFNPSWGADYEVAVIDLASGKTAVSIRCQCMRMAFSPDGKLIATAMMTMLGNRVQLWDASSGKEIATNRGPFPRQRAP